MSKKLLASLLAVVMVISLLPATVLAADFSDTNGHWGQSAINRWADVGILSGKGDGNFDPNGTMTRAEFAQMLSNMMGYTTKAANVFTDVPAGAWYEDAMLKLMAAGVIQGNGDGTANPNGPITREQAAVMLCRAFDIQPSRSASLSYNDSASISSWARDAMAALAERGMMNGVGDNTAAPQLNINRASVATLADNMIAEYVTESKTITGKVDGIILVAGGVSVNLDNATVSQPVIVAPKASGVNVNLTGTTTADDIVVEANGAKVNVGAEASASSVVSSAPNADITVSGKVDSVEVAGSNNSVSVSGTVGTVTAEAPNTNVTVSGTVNNVDISSSASRSSVNVTASGKVDSVATDASNVSVSGNGTVGNVTSTGGSVDVTTKGTEVSNQGGNATAGGKNVASGETATSTGTSGGGSSSSSSSSDDYDEPANDNNQQQQPSGPAAGDGGNSGGDGGGNGNSGDSSVKHLNGLIIEAPLEDHVGAGAIDQNKLATGYKVEGVETETDTYTVTITANDLMKHKSNAESDSGGNYWVGFGMRVEGTWSEDGKTFTPSNKYEYKHGVEDRTGTVGQRFYKAEEKQTGGTYTYNTIYFNEADIKAALATNDGTTTVTQKITTTVTTQDGEGTGTTESTTTTLTFNVTFNVSYWNAKDNIEVAHSVTGDTGDTYNSVNFFDTKVTKITVAKDTEPEKLHNCNVTLTLDESAEYTAGDYYYVLTITDANIKKITCTQGSTSQAVLSTAPDTIPAADTVDNLTATTKILVKVALAAEAEADITQTFNLYDEAGRVQGTLTVKIAAAGVTVNAIVPPVPEVPTKDVGAKVIDSTDETPSEPAPDAVPDEADATV